MKKTWFFIVLSNVLRCCSEHRKTMCVLHLSFIFGILLVVVFSPLKSRIRVQTMQNPTAAPPEGGSERGGAKSFPFGRQQLHAFTGLGLRGPHRQFSVMGNKGSIREKDIRNLFFWCPRCHHWIRLILQYRVDRFSAPDIDLRPQI